MFSNILGALQGPSVEAKDDADEVSNKDCEDAERGSDSGFTFWGVASALADSVKQTTADITASMGETDWRAEIEAFGKGVAEDANHVQLQAHAVAKEGVHRIETLPQQAAKAKFTPVDSARLKSQFDQVGSTLGRFGTKVLASSKDMFEQVAEAVQHELDGLEGHINKPRGSEKTKVTGAETTKFNRLEADISAMQRSSSTYCDQPQDIEAFNVWLQTFDLAAKKSAIDAVIHENAFMAELQSRIVPLIVQYDTFWTRYFYQLHKVTEKHKQMQQVVQRARSQAPAEELSWDCEEDSRKSGALDAHCTGSSNLLMDDAAAGNLASDSVKKATAHTPEEEAETSTASDDSSGHTPWTVVSSPTHKRQTSQEMMSPPRESSRPPQPLDHAYANFGARSSAAPNRPVDMESSEVDVTAEQYVKSAQSDLEADDSDIDISDDDKADNASEVEEDWGLWD